MQESFVYIITNPNKTVFYTAVTADLCKRMTEHAAGRYGPESFAGRNNVKHLVYYERHGNISDAFAREKEIKGWRREKKVKLIESLNPFWRFLEAEEEFI